MTSSIPSRSSPDPEILLLFFQKLNELPGDTAKVVIIMENILNGRESPGLEGDLAARVTELEGMLARPAQLSKKVNTLAFQSLRDEMKEIVKGKIQSLTARQIYSEILTEIPPHRISTFVDTVEGFYHQTLLKGKSHQEALIFALGKGVLRSMIKLPSSDEITSNKKLQSKIEADPELEPYMCTITGDLAISDTVYLREDVDGNPRERYKENAITDWLQKNPTDPIERSAKTLADIKPDLKGRGFVEKKIVALLYPELISEQAERPVAKRALHSKALLLSLAAAYPEIQEKHEESAEKIISRFASIVEGMNWEGEEVVSPCFPVIKEFLRQAERNLTDENLEEVKVDLISKLGTFVTFFHEIEPFKLSSKSQAKSLAMAGDAIGNGASFEEIMEQFTQYASSITEEDEIRETFPGCLIGKAEWDTHLGTIEDVALPEGMLAILSQNSPITPGKKVGETHTLVLIPSEVNGQPLTLNSLGALVKSKGHFADTEAGYKYMDSNVDSEPGNNQVGSSHWVLMTKDVLPGSRSKKYAEQQAIVATLARTSGASYEVPGVMDAAACIFMNYLASPSRTRLFSDSPWTYTRCQEDVLGYPVVIGGFAPAGLEVYNCVYDVDNHGVAALRKFWA